MVDGVTFLNLHDIQAAHKAVLVRYGGEPGVRDLGALEAACYRPQTGYYMDLIAMAAVLVEGLIYNRPFVDNNARVGMVCADVFLRLNHHMLYIDHESFFNSYQYLYQHNLLQFDAIDALLRPNVFGMGES